jgi:hypothetical protein
MGPFLYRCPNTGFRVQGLVEDAEAEDGETYQGVICHACGQLHLVNPKTGKRSAETTSRPLERWSTPGLETPEFRNSCAIDCTEIPTRTVSAHLPRREGRLNQRT